MAAAETPPAAVLPTWVQLRLRVRDLTLPPDWQQSVEGSGRKGRYRQWGEEDLKVQYHFGGWAVGTLREHGDLIVVALVHPHSNTNGGALDHLTPDERKRVVWSFPFREDGKVEPLPPPADAVQG
jgi:hypothetical protein